MGRFVEGKRAENTPGLEPSTFARQQLAKVTDLVPKRSPRDLTNSPNDASRGLCFFLWGAFGLLWRPWGDPGHQNEPHGSQNGAREVSKVYFGGYGGMQKESLRSFPLSLSPSLSLPVPLPPSLSASRSIFLSLLLSRSLLRCLSHFSFAFLFLVLFLWVCVLVWFLVRHGGGVARRALGYIYIYIYIYIYSRLVGRGISISLLEPSRKRTHSHTHTHTHTV